MSLSQSALGNTQLGLFQNDLSQTWPFKFSNSPPITIVYSLSIWLLDIMNFSRKMGLHIMCANHDNLSFVICISNENSGLICSMIHLLVFLVLHSILTIFSNAMRNLLGVQILCNTFLVFFTHPSQELFPPSFLPGSKADLEVRDGKRDK